MTTLNRIVFAWCFSHGDLHRFAGTPHCNGTWVAFPHGVGQEGEVLAAKEAAYGTARFLDDLGFTEREAVAEVAGKLPSPLEVGMHTVASALAETESGYDPARHATEGIDTPGCDCGHDGMGAGWHVSCAWVAGLDS